MDSLRRSQLYQFDEYGNIQSIETDGSLLETTTSESTNRLSSQGAEFDARGNLTSWSSTTFVYDALNRMSRRVVAGEPEYHFLYTADDERILSVAAPPGEPLELHWALRDFGGKVLREYVNPPAALVPAHDYIFRGDQPLGEVDFTTPTPTTYHLTLDHLGTPRLKTSTTGAVVQKWKYFPFGEEAIPATQSGTALRFTGHERDRFNLGGAADDVDYMHARSHSPVTARFMSADPKNRPSPLPNPQRFNRYAYVSGNPLKLVDPNGKEQINFRITTQILAPWVWAPYPSMRTPIMFYTGGVKTTQEFSVQSDPSKSARSLVGEPRQDTGRTFNSIGENAKAEVSGLSVSGARDSRGNALRVLRPASRYVRVS